MKSLSTLISTLCILLLSSVGLNAQTLVNTSFETTDSYTTGTVHNKNKWTVTTGIGEIVTLADYVKDGTQALKIGASATALQVDRTDFATNAVGLAGDVYLDFWIKLKTLPSANFGITGYDLGTTTHRSFMVEFLPTSKLKIYDGSAGWATQPDFTVNAWTRISIKIDNGAGKYQLAINGVVQNKIFTFREIRNGATVFDYHSTRFSMVSGTCDVAFDNLYIGSTPISDIAFQSSSTDRTIAITQPAYGTIALSPVKATYQLNDQVSASITVPDHYLFTGWTGDLSGTTNPQAFTVDKNYIFGATVIVDPANPPAQSTITITQPVGATITLVPQQTVYYNGTSVSAQLSIQSGYQFNGWSGSLSGTTNPASFVVNGDMAIGASVSAIQVSSTTRTVSTVTQFKDALAAMNPGDTVLVLDGTYNLGGLKVTKGGSALKPILVRSKNLYGAKITGPTYFNLSYQSYVTYEGFDINVDAGSTIFKMEGCSNVRITRNWLRMPTITDTQTSKWVTIGDLWDSEICNSHDNRFDHNLFDGKFDQGAWLVIDGSHGTVPAISQHDRIDHNIFRNNTPRVTNEKETIRIGVSDLCKLDAYTVVENNLFEDCDGDPEIVSLKSCKDTVRYNTFRRCVGTVSLRQGNNSVVEGNFFFGENKTTLFGTETIGCGGVRIYGMNHKIINNYFEGLTGDKWDAACTITNGDVTNASSSNSSHFLAENVVFAFNTLVNNKSNIEVGFDNNGAYGLAPKSNILANNIVVGPVNPFIKYYSTASLTGVSFQNNLMYPTGSATLGLTGTTDAQIKTIDPQLIKSSCKAYGQNCDQRSKYDVYKLTSGSPAIDASIGYTYVTRDFEGQAAIGIRDIGADEYNASVSLVNVPLDEQMVGPTAPEMIEYEITTTTGIAETFTSGLTVSPNPFAGETTLSIPVEVPGKVSISLYNATGQQIQRTERQAPEGKFDYPIITNVKGILFCVVELADKRYTVKLITK
ncbi:MAG: chondroitinase-B domain-containing protein [Paludibacter sp.]|nr:chondroitinase-B domain-containing protein [Paludibacter sp.]